MWGKRWVLIGVVGGRGGGGVGGRQVVLLLLSHLVVAAAAARWSLTWVRVARRIFLLWVLLRVLGRLGGWVAPMVQGGTPHVVERGVEVGHHLGVSCHSG